MRRTLFVLLCILWATVTVAVFAVIVKGDDAVLSWEYEGDPPDGFRIYQRVAGGDYDYTSPVVEVAGDQRETKINLPGEPDAAVKYEFVARAYLADDDSEDSNEVEYTVVRIKPPVPIDLSGEFSRSEGVIHIAWIQPTDDYEIDSWRVYYRMSGTEEEYAELGIVHKDNPLEITATFNAVAGGDRADIDFVVVAYRKNGTYSGNSNTVTVDVDRRELDVPQNLRINIEIPVE